MKKGCNMSDNKYSWYTVIHPDYEGWPAPPIYRLVGPAIEQSGETTCDIYYKENRKGGHMHNHVRNAHKRMHRCHICDAPITKYEGIMLWFYGGHICLDCWRLECEEEASLTGLTFREKDFYDGFRNPFSRPFIRYARKR